MTKNYEIVEGIDTSLRPPQFFDSFSGALNALVRMNQTLHKEGYVVGPILNGQFVYYTVGEDDEQGTILNILDMSED